MKSLTGTRPLGRVITGLAAVAATAFALVGCSPSSGPSGDTTGAGSNTPIIIGGSLGLTGAYSGPSAGYKLAYDYWAQQVNAAGGLLGRQVKFDIIDDTSTPATAQQIYQRFASGEEHADVLVAPYTTSVGGSVVPITERAGMLMMNPGFVSKKLQSQSKLLISGWPYQEPEYPLPFFSYLATLPDSQRPTTLAVVTAQNPFTDVALNGYNGEGGVLNDAKQNGIKVVFNQQYDQSATDLTSLIQQAKASGAQAFVALSLPNDANLIAKTVNQVGYNPKYYCSCGSQVTTLANWKDNGAAAQNVMSTTTAWPTQGFEGQKALADYFAKNGFADLPSYGAVAYATLQVLGDAIKATKSLDSQTLHDYIIKSSFDTVEGTIKYNSDGTLAFGALLVQYQGTDNQVIWPSKYATAPAKSPLVG